MSDYLSTPCTAFAGTSLVASGLLIDVALAVKAAESGSGASGLVITFDDSTGRVIDMDLRGTTAEIVRRLTAQGEAMAQAAAGQGGANGGGDGVGNSVSGRSRGRPRLGVVGREVTLLPRHWDWLGKQAGGASQALRRLVDEARRADGGQTDGKAAQERTYRFLSALAGDLPGYEEAIRALFAGDGAGFAARMETWPPDVRDHALKLSRHNPKEDRS